MSTTMTREELAESVAGRIYDALEPPTPAGRDYNPKVIADLAEVLYGPNDDDVKALRGIQGPVAESVAYLEDATADFLVILPDSRRYTPADPNDFRPHPNANYAHYTAAILDTPGDPTTARCIGTHTEYLATKCTPVDWNDVPLATQAALLGILARKDEPGTWDKKPRPDTTG